MQSEPTTQATTATRKPLLGIASPADANSQQQSPGPRVTGTSRSRVGSGLNSTEGIEPDALTKAKARLDEMYDLVAQKWPGFIARDGQREMMDQALLAFLSAKDAAEVTEGLNLATLEAGTGTGKTVAYSLAAIAASHVTGKKILLSTATVALQEQLVERDLPRLSAVLGGLDVKIVKGRGRYVCQSKLDGVFDEGPDAGWFIDFGAEEGQAAKPDQSLVNLAQDLSERLDKDTWNGDIDSLGKPIDQGSWRKLQADAGSCTATKCPNYVKCAFYKARNTAKDAQILVANHALLLSSLEAESKLLDPEDRLLVLDEAHHIPDIAAAQFTSEARLLSLERGLPKLKTLLQKAAKECSSEIAALTATLAADVTDCSDKVRDISLMLQSSRLLDTPEIYRFPSGLVPEGMSDVFLSTHASLRSLVSTCDAFHSDLGRKDAESGPSQKEIRRRLQAEIGAYSNRVREAAHTFKLMARHEKVPLVKWMQAVRVGNSIDVRISACPLTPAGGLILNLWSKVSAAVCTSATITACGSFDYFDRLTGLNRFPKRRALVVKSPFDFERQGELRIAGMASTPKMATFSDELVMKLPELLDGHEGGQLVLFTSKRQMAACFEGLPPALRRDVQVQGDSGRAEMLREHAKRVDLGKRAILFGLQSLGEGIDLPGQLCTHVIIDKLPFTPPTSPTEAALAEWLEEQGRDAFNEISVPKVSMTLAQWVGRGIRTVSDQAVITICDTRLASTRYGQQILRGLPPFPVVIGHTDARMVPADQPSRGSVARASGARKGSF